MYYLKVSDNKEIERAVNSLKELGFAASTFSQKETNDDVKGVATYINKLEGSTQKYYILLKGYMLNDDPRISWITSRRQVFSVDELIEKVKEALS